MSAIASLGLGRVGRPMAANRVARGHEVTAWNRTAATADAFATEHRAGSAPTPGAAARSADFVISMLADDAALLSAYLGDDGVLNSLPDAAVCIDVATASPGTVARLHDLVSKRGGSFVDATVSGSVAARRLAIGRVGNATDRLREAHLVPRLRRRDPHRAVQHLSDRVAQPLLAARGQGQRLPPHRESRRQVPLPHSRDPTRTGQGAMNNAVGNKF